MLKLKQKGFTVIEGLLLLVIVGILGFTGWYVWHSKVTSESSYNKTQSISGTTSSSKSPITKDQAIQIVTNLSNVKDFVARMVSSKTPYRIDVDPPELQEANSGNPYWVIHVYEVQSDHLATFNWYRVSQKTGKVETEF